MEQGLLSRAVEYIKRQRQKKRWQKVVTSMAAVVVFCTTYALILPAITLENQAVCGQEVHLHGPDCYGQVLTCGLTEVEVHTHTDTCYETQQTLVCAQTESAGHIHSPECQQTVSSLTCTSTEEGHTHGDGCYTTSTTYICGQAEVAGHTHSAECWQTVSTLVCTQSTEAPAEGHTHTEACYGPSQELTCGLTQHEHSEDCYSDTNADRETAAEWEKTFDQVELTGAFPEDVLAIAETQLGYTESETNFIRNDEGRKLGYSRYGAWYGDPYGDWCAMFVSFCLHYAEVPADAFPLEASCQRWIDDLTERELYREAESYNPKPGDLIFFNWDKEPDSDHVGLVEEIVLDEAGEPVQVKTIEGNCSNQVKTMTYALTDSSIMGYGELPEKEETIEIPADVANVIAMIDALPAADEVDEKLLALEEAENWEAYEVYFTGVGQQGLKAYNAYAALSEDQRELVTNLNKLMELEYIWSRATLEATPETLPAGNYGSYTLAYNEVKDAFTSDPAYARFYNASSPLGTAGSFHIVAFDTAYLNVHTNGNVLAKNLYAPSNFGTNSKNGVNLIEISYAQNYLQVNHNSAADVEDYLVIGSSNTISVEDNGNALSVNGTKQDMPKNLIQDLDTDTTPFIDLDRVEAEIKTIARNLNSYNASGESVLRSETTTGDLYLELTDPDNVGIYKLTAEELNAIARIGNGWDMKGFETGRNGAIVINVDCRNWDRTKPLKMPEARVWVDGKPVNLTETLDFTAGKVVWNFVNAQGVTVESNLMTGMIIAPESHIDLMLSFNGTAIGNSVKNHSETHRTDFNGNIVPKKDQDIDGAHIHVYKVDKSNYGNFLQGAEFALYEWSGSAWVIANQNSREQIDITDNNGQVIFRDLTYNVAYKLVETKAPPGYAISQDPLFFFFENDNTTAYPVRKPIGFKASGEDDCITHYCPNEVSNVEQTSLRVDKKWVSQNGDPLPYIPWDSVTFGVWVSEARAMRDSQGNLIYGADNAVVYGEPGEPELYGTYTLTKEDGWNTVVNMLPVTNQDLTVKYTYSVREVLPKGAEYTANVTEDPDGSITITNKVNVESIYAPIVISKAWITAGSSVDSPPEDISSVTFQLWRMSKMDPDGEWSAPELVLDQISVGHANNWSWDSGGNTLLAQQTVGTETTYYAYYVVETGVPDGYYPSYGGISQTDPMTGQNNWVIKTTNTEIGTMDLSIRKEWLDRSGQPMETVDVESITVQLQQSADGGATWTNYGDPITMRDDPGEGWNYTVMALPLKSPNGEELTYRVMETPVEGFVITGGEEISDNTVTITNTQVDTTFLQIKKEWLDARGNPMNDHGQDAVQIQIQRSEDGGATWTDYGAPVTITAAEGWETTVTGLPLTDPARENVNYIYTVREENIGDLFASTVTTGEDGVITVTNQETIHTDLKVEKLWFKNGIQYDWSSGSVDVNLYQILKGDGAQSGGAGEKVNVTVKIGQYNLDTLVSNHTMAVPVGTVVNVSYRIPSLDGDPALWKDVMWDSNSALTPVITENGSTRIFTYSHTVTGDTTLYGKVGYWDLNACSVSISFDQPKPVAMLVGTATLNPGNNWKHTFRGLPKVVQDEAGNTVGEYGYYVEEVGGEAYSVVYTTAGGDPVSADSPVTSGTIRVKNTITEEIFALPETGGIGLGLGQKGYILGGILLSVGALLWYRKQENGREGPAS